MVGVDGLTLQDISELMQRLILKRISHEFQDDGFDRVTGGRPIVNMWSPKYLGGEPGGVGV